MSDQGKYLPLWRKYLPAIRVLLKNSKSGRQILTLQKHEFEAIGNREVSSYTFNLELRNGEVIFSTIKGTAVARDLLLVLNENSEVVEWLKDKNVKINMGKSFELHLQSQ